jgi:hypothetical protein
MHLVRRLRGVEAALRRVDLALERLGLGGDRRKVRIAQGKLGLQGRQRLTNLALLSEQGIQALLLLSLLLLQLRQPVGKRGWIIRMGWHCGQEQQQRRKGGCWANYAGGAPAEPGMPGSRRGLKVVPPRGGVTPFGFFSFFFFFSSRCPLSRDFAMVLPP